MFPVPLQLLMTNDINLFMSEETIAIFQYIQGKTEQYDHKKLRFSD